ncbi:MAG: cobalamin B12-binding domain-containing protein [Acidobacteriota bacterium]
MPDSKPRLRLLIGKVGLDGHDRGAKIIARALRDAGHEVIYTGLHRTPDQVVETAVQEDVDGIGLSILSGAHLTLFPKVIALLAQRKAGDIAVFGGGIIPDEDVEPLRQAGVKGLFMPGTSTEDLIRWVEGNIQPRHLQD